MQQHVSVPTACNFECQPASGDSTGLLAFPIVVVDATCHAAQVEFGSATGLPLDTAASGLPAPLSLGMYLSTFQQPDGFIVAARPYLGPSPLPVMLAGWDETAAFPGTVTWYQAAARYPPTSTSYGPNSSFAEATAANPSGGVFVAGDLRLTPEGPFTHAAAMFERDGSMTVRWGLVPIDSGGLVVGAGVDVLGRSLVLTDGADAFGPGSVAGQWLDVDGTPLTCAFQLLSNYQALPGAFGSFAWLDAVPLAGSGLAVRRVDVVFGSDRLAHTSRRYLAVVDSGASTFSAPPAWVADVDGADLRLVRGGRAYAVLRNGGPATPCTQRVDVVALDGTPCGGRDYPVNDGVCTTLPMTMGEDGTLIQELPTALEPVTIGPALEPLHACTWRWWPGALK